MAPPFLWGSWRRAELMTSNLKLYAPLKPPDGRPPKSSAAEQQLWKIPLKKKLVMWPACLVLIVCFIFMSFDYSSDSPITPSPEKHVKFRSDHVSLNSTPDIVSPTAKLKTRPRHVSDVTKLIDFSVGGCNIWKGEWIRHPDGPAYTNATCPYIQPNQDCIKNGRPDRGFLYWRWKPRDCELPLFDAEAFLNVVAGKKWAFIGDSLARNSYQSLICYLAQVEVPESTFNDGADGNMRWYFRSYNFTLAVVWTPFLVKGTEDEADGLPKGFAKLHLDVTDEVWAPSLHDYDYVVLSGGHWYLRTSVYFVQSKPIGCFYCPKMNYTDVGYPFAYREALRTVFDFLISSKYKGVVFFRTYSPEHWEHALWDQGGNCTRKAPVKRKSIALEGVPKEMYKIQLEEFGKTVKRRSEFSFKLKIVDGTLAALLRPDAHPGPYGHAMHPKMQHDCVHWCLPGAVDTWSAMIQEVLNHL